MFKNKFVIALISIMCATTLPANAQWAKVAKGAGKYAEKALKGGTTKSVSKSVTRGTTTTKSTSGYGNVSRSAAAASQYYGRNQQQSQVVRCAGCNGRGWYLYNGYRYKCNYCNGSGSVVIQK